MNFNYIGWVPCINGDLDFGLAKPGIEGSFSGANARKNTESTAVNYAYDDKKRDHHARRVMLQSKVDWKDSKGSGFDGDFRVFLLAESPTSICFNERYLQGKLYIYRCRLEPEDVNKIDGLTQFQAIYKAEKINANNQIFSEKQVALNECYDNLQKSLESLEDVYIVDFFMESNGLTYLKYGSCKTDIEEDEKYIVVRQAYYYLKYSLHEHKHHDFQMDSLMTIVPFINSSAGKKESGLRLLGQLKRELTSIKRTQSIGDSYEIGDPAGILSYMNSLINTLGFKGFLSNNFRERELKYLCSVRSSFEAQKVKLSKRKEIESSNKTAYRVYFGWSLALISLASMLLLKAYIVIPQKEYIKVTLSLWDSAIVFMVVVVVVFLVYFFLLKQKIKRELDDTGFKEWIDSAYQASDKKFFGKKIIYVLINLAVVACLIWASIYI